MRNTISFGCWVRQRRMELGLTQQELAYHTGCACVTIQKIESDACRPSSHMAKRLAQSLQISSADHNEFLSLAHSYTTSITPSPNTLPNDVNISGWAPHLTTPLIGHEDVTKTLSAILMRTDVRLLTLTGPPGVGKTSLAIQLVTTLDIDTSAHPNILDALCMSLCERQMLLVLDNFEQLHTASSVLTKILSHAAQIKFLITSRVCLGISSEHIFTVPPLSLSLSD